jgi:phospholipid/cholesterol/gamma-HCH transport system substrate-binding protein
VNRGLEFKVGLTVLTAIAIAIAAIVWLKEITLHAQKRVYIVAFPSTGGLAASDEVQVNGMRKGQVRDMRLSGDRVLVDVELESDVTLTHDSRVAIRDVGMMGEKVIAIELRSTGGAYTARDTVPGIYESGISEVMGRVGASIDAVTALVNDLHDVTQEIKGGGELGTTIRDFAATSHELRAVVTENRAQMTQTLRNFSDASRTAKSLTTDREQQLREAMDHFSSAAEKMDRLSGRLDSLRASVQTLTTRVNSGDGTLGKLVNDQRLYDDLSTSVTSLKVLIEDIKKNPRKYFKVSVF